MTDPFEHFEEQQQSYEMLEQHRELLATDAADFARQHPEIPTVGLVLAPNAPEAAPLRAALEKASGQDFAGRGFIGVTPRGMVVDILRSNYPAALDWLEDSGGEGDVRKLPIVAITEHGIRLGCVDYSV